MQEFVNEFLLNEAHTLKQEVVDEEAQTTKEEVVDEAEPNHATPTTLLPVKLIPVKKEFTDVDVGEVYASIWRCNTKEEEVDSWKEDEVDGNKEIKEEDEDWHQEGCASQEIKEYVVGDTIEIKEEEADSCEEDGQYSDWLLRSIQEEELNDQYIEDQTCSILFKCFYQPQPPLPHHHLGDNQMLVHQHHLGDSHIHHTNLGVHLACLSSSPATHVITQMISHVFAKSPLYLVAVWLGF